MHASQKKFCFRPQILFVLILANSLSIVATHSYSQIARNLVHATYSIMLSQQHKFGRRDRFLAVIIGKQDSDSHY